MIEKEGETQDRHYAASLKKKKVLATKFINNERGIPQPSETNNLKRREKKEDLDKIKMKLLRYQTSKM